jgi:hypothetical protein
MMLIGWLQTVPSLGDTVDSEGRAFRRGFPVRFLSREASGVVAALGQVNVEHATRMATQLLQQSRATPSSLDFTRDGANPRQLPRLSQLLRDARHAVANEITTHDPQEDSWLRFVYTFMYVYYGNPNLTLQIGYQPGGSVG